MDNIFGLAIEITLASPGVFRVIERSSGASSALHKLAFDEGVLDVLIAEIHRSLFAINTNHDLPVSSFRRLGAQIAALVLPPEINGKVEQATDVVGFYLDDYSLKIPVEILPCQDGVLADKVPVIRHWLYDADHVSPGKNGVVDEKAAKNALLVADPAGDLPSAAAEGQSIMGFLKEKKTPWRCRYLGHLVTVDALTHELPDTELLHIAAHYHDGSEKEEHGIAMSDGYWLPNRIPHTPDIVFLNCCRAGQVSNDHGSQSLIGKFLQQGTRHVIAPFLPTSDGIAKRFADEFYSVFNTPDTVTESIFKARQTLGAAGLLYLHYGTDADAETLSARRTSPRYRGLGLAVLLALGCTLLAAIGAVEYQKHRSSREMEQQLAEVRLQAAQETERQLNDLRLRSTEEMERQLEETRRQSAEEMEKQIQETRLHSTQETTRRLDEMRRQSTGEMERQLAETQRQSAEKTKQQIEENRIQSAQETECRLEAVRIESAKEMERQLAETRRQSEEEMERRLAETRRRSAQETEQQLKDMREQSAQETERLLAAMRFESTKEMERQLEETRRQSAQETERLLEENRLQSEQETERRLEQMRLQSERELERRLDEARQQSAQETTQQIEIERIRAEKEMEEWLEQERLQVIGEMLDQEDRCGTRVPGMMHTLMGEAVKAGDIPVMTLILSRKWPINGFDEYGMTAFAHAVNAGQIEAMDWLKEHGADIHKYNKNQSVPLHIAAFARAFPVMEWLHKNGVDVNVQDANGNTAMMYAAYKGFVDVMQWLYDRGAKVDAMSNEGHTPLIRAEEMDQTEAIQWIERMMAKNKTDAE